MNKREYTQANKDWLTNKAQEEGVKPLPKGIYYKVLAEGKADGKHPTPRSIVTAHYTGRTIDGKQFAPYLAEGASIVNISSSRDRWSQAHSRQHPRCPYPHDCREPNGGERRNGKGCGEFDKPGESVKKRYNLVKTNKS